MCLCEFKGDVVNTRGQVDHVCHCLPAAVGLVKRVIVSVLDLSICAGSRTLDRITPVFAVIVVLVGFPEVASDVRIRRTSAIYSFDVVLISPLYRY